MTAQTNNGTGRLQNATIWRHSRVLGFRDILKRMRFAELLKLSVCLIVVSGHGSSFFDSDTRRVKACACLWVRIGDQQIGQSAPGLPHIRIMRPNGLAYDASFNQKSELSNDFVRPAGMASGMCRDAHWGGCAIKRHSERRSRWDWPQCRRRISGAAALNDLGNIAPTSSVCRAIAFTPPELQQV